MNIRKSPRRRAFVGANKNGVTTYSSRKEGMLRMEVQGKVIGNPAIMTSNVSCNATIKGIGSLQHYIGIGLA